MISVLKFFKNKKLTRLLEYKNNLIFCFYVSKDSNIFKLKYTLSNNKIFYIFFKNYLFISTNFKDKNIVNILLKFDLYFMFFKYNKNILTYNQYLNFLKKFKYKKNNIINILIMYLRLNLIIFHKLNFLNFKKINFLLTKK
jgi:hypothetical protein